MGPMGTRLRFLPTFSPSIAALVESASEVTWKQLLEYCFHKSPESIRTVPLISEAIISLGHNTGLSQATFEKIKKTASDYFEKAAQAEEQKDESEFVRCDQIASVLSALVYVLQSAKIEPIVVDDALYYLTSTMGPESENYIQSFFSENKKEQKNQKEKNQKGQA